MKTLILIVILITLPSASFAQRVQSSCDAPDSVKNLYRSDAAGLAYDYQISLHPSWKDSTAIPHTLQDTFLRALIAVYNAVQIPDAYRICREGIFHEDQNFRMPIHDHLHPYFDTIWLENLDTTINWVKNLFNKQIPTGNASIDSLIQTFGIGIDHVQEWNGLADFKIHTKTYFNIYLIVNLWNKIAGNQNAYYRIPTGGNGDYIQQTKFDSIIYLTYSFGWGDCYSGCIYRNYWHFSVYPDCSVSFDGAEGIKEDDYISNSNEIKIYPNPALATIIIAAAQNSTIEILDFQGKILQSTLSKESKAEMDVSMLPKGTYFVRTIAKSGKIETGKFIKE
jgi:hypothetical protein